MQAMDFLSSMLLYKSQQFEFGTLDAFHNDEIFNQLPPRLQLQLVEKCLDRYIKLMEYFFNNYETVQILEGRRVMVEFVTRLQFASFEAN